MPTDHIRSMSHRSPGVEEQSSSLASDALQQSGIKVGDEVEGEVTELRPNSLRLNIKGRKGWVSAERLGLAAGEVQKGPFRAGDRLRVRIRGTVGSGEDVDCEPLIKVYDEVEGKVVQLRPSSLRLDINGWTGWISDAALGLVAGEVENGPFRIGDELKVQVVRFMARGSLECKLAAGAHRRSGAEPDTDASDPTRPHEHDAQHPELRGGERFRVKCVAVNDRYATFEILGLPGWEGHMRSDEWSLKATDVAEFAEGDVMPAVVLGVNDRKAKRVDLSARRARDDWRDACLSLLAGQSVQGIVSDVRSGGVRIDLGPLTDWVSDADATLEAGGRANETYSIGQRVDVYIVGVRDVERWNPRLTLSLRRAMSDWHQLVKRIKPGSLSVGQVLPRAAQIAGVVKVDLGPIDGIVSSYELADADADSYARENAWSKVKVMVEKFGLADIEAAVSIARYEDRWRDLAHDLREGEIVKAEYLKHDEVAVDADLGAGLIVRVPTAEWKTDAALANQEPESYTVGDPIDVRIVSIDHESQTIAGSLRPNLTGAQQRVVELLQGRESKLVEFKPGLRKLEGEERDLEFEVLKNIVAFLNAEGGDLLIGVTDAGEPTGILRDGWQDIDAAQRHLEQRINTRIGREYWNFISSECVRYDELDLLLVTISRLPRESKLARLIVGREEKVFARLGSSAHPLEGKEAADYQFARITGTDYEMSDSDGPTGTQ